MVDFDGLLILQKEMLGVIYVRAIPTQIVEWDDTFKMGGRKCYKNGKEGGGKKLVEGQNRFKMLGGLRKW